MDESKTADSRIAELEQIDINQWVLFGGGATGESYYHVSDVDLMLKLYTIDVSYDEVETEFKIGFIANSLKLPAPASYKMVAFGDRLGIVFQRLHGKVSIARAIGQNPDCMEEYVQRLVDVMHEIHGIQANTDAMVPTVNMYREAVIASYYLSDSQQKFLLNFLDGVPCTTTCVHGDYHAGNVVVSEGRNYAIDLGTLSYGNPLFDEGSMGNVCLVMARFSPHTVPNYYHMEAKTMQEVWKVFCRLHAGAETPSQREEYEHMLRPYVLVDAVRKACCMGFKQNQVSSVKTLLSEIGQ